MNNDFGWLIAAIAALAYLGLWIWALIETGNNRKWGWFIAVFLFSPVLLVIYVLVGRTNRGT